MKFISGIVLICFIFTNIPVRGYAAAVDSYSLRRPAAIDQGLIWEEDLRNAQKAKQIEVHQFAKEVLKDLPSESTILSLGSGSGIDEIFFAKAGHTVVATDFVESAIKELNEKINQENIKNLTTKVQDLTKTFDFQNESFDVVYSHLSLNFMTDAEIAKAIKEISRVLKPSGRLYLIGQSVSDSTRGQGEEIEKDTFIRDRKLIHYFSKEYIEKRFADFEFKDEDIVTGERVFYPPEGRVIGFVQLKAKKAHILPVKPAIKENTPGTAVNLLIDKRMLILQQLSKKTPSKIFFLVIDGLGGLPIDGKTELEAANHPELDNLSKKSAVGSVNITDILGVIPGSGPGHFSIFGYDPYKSLGRGVLDAFGAGIEVKEGDIVARGNLATIENGILIDRRAGRIPTEKAEALIKQCLSDIEIEEVKFHFYSTKEHRLALIVRGGGLTLPITDSDPGKEGMSPLEFKAQVKDSERLAGLMNKLNQEINRRLNNNTIEPKANTIVFRGFDTLQKIPSLRELYKLDALASCVYPAYKGIAQAIGMQILPLTGAAISDQTRTVKENLQKGDFFYIHIKTTDKYGEDGKFADKVKVIEEVDALIPEILGMMDLERGDTLVVTADHSTPARMKSHSWHSVPALIYSKDSFGKQGLRFTEEEAQRGSLGIITGRDIMSLALAHAGKLDKIDGPLTVEGGSPGLPVWHRGGGFSEGLPRNSLAAFEYALSHGANSIEFDVLLCNNGEIIVAEDNLLKEKGLDIDNLAFNDLKNIDVGNAKYGKQAIPKLEEVLDIVKGKDVELQIHIKGNKKEIVGRLLGTLKQKDMVKNVLVTCFDRDFLKELRNLDKGIKLGWLVWPGNWKEEKVGSGKDWTKALKDYGKAVDLYTNEEITEIINEAKAWASVLVLHASRINKESVNAIHEANLDIGGWGVGNDIMLAWKLATFGVGRFTLDNAEEWDKLIDFFYAHSRFFKEVGGEALLPEYLKDIWGWYVTLKSKTFRLDDIKLALVVPSSFFKKAGAIDALNKVIKLQPGRVMLGIYGEGADKIRDLFSDKSDIITAKTAGELKSELEEQKIKFSEDVVVLNPIGGKVDDLVVRQVGFSEKTISSVAVAKAMQVLLGANSEGQSYSGVILNRFKKFYEDMKSQGVISSETYEETKARVFDGLDLPDIEPVPAISDKIKDDADTIYKFIDKFI